MTPQPEWFERDFYADLGVDPDASKSAITKAYKRLAKENHPDAHPDDEAAADRFRRAASAYEVLRDDAKRREYDEVRRMVAAGATGPGFRPGGRGGPGFEEVHFEFGGDDLGDLFAGLFGQGRGPGGARGGGFAGPRSGGVPGRDVETEVTLSFDEALEGVTRAVRFATDRTDGEREVKVRIPVGVEDGQRIRVAGRGEPGRGAAPAGDLYVRVRVRPHPVFGRRGSDLTVRLPVTFPEAALGANVRVPTLDEPVTVRIPPGTPSGKVLRVRGRGAPRPGGSRGDLLATVEVDVPESLTDDQRRAVEALAATLGDDPRARLFDE